MEYLCNIQVCRPDIAKKICAFDNNWLGLQSFSTAILYFMFGKLIPIYCKLVTMTGKLVF